MNTNENPFSKYFSQTRRSRVRKPDEYYQSEEYKQKYAEHQIKKELKIIQMKLESSMGSQTEALKKPTYKELEKQPFLAMITAKLEMNDHDGYCSDEDCKYTKKIVKANIVVPDEFKDFPVGRCDIRKRRYKKVEYKWANHLPLPDVPSVMVTPVVKEPYSQ